MERTLTVRGLNLGILASQQYATGYYRDAITGQLYYYNADTGQWYIYAAGLLYPLSTELAVWPGVGQWGGVMQVGGYAGSITKVVIRYGSQDLVVPATITLGSSVELHGFGLLAATSPATKCGMNCIIKKPDGTYLNGQYNMSTLQNPGQELRFSMISFFADQAGPWYAIVRYYTID